MNTPIPFGRYLLLDRLAIGGMAEVYVAIARDDAAGRLYTVKRILPTLAEDEELVGMFLDEARIVAHLNHPGIVALHDLGKLGDTYYLAYEYVPGQDLRALLDRARQTGEPVPVPLAAYVAWRVADALEYAHRKRDARGRELGVVHRDVSPANVLLGYDGSVRIIDFGVAQAAFRTRREETVLRGKFGYMSPEAARGEPVDRRSDVFALGVVLHEALTGARLFTGASELAVLDRVQHGTIGAPSRVNPAVPPGLDAVVLRALARDASDRWGSAGELRDALAPWLHAGTPPGDPPALARFMARQFAAELRAELERVERLGARLDPAPAGTPVASVPAPEGASEREATVVAPAPPGSAPRKRAVLAGVLALALLSTVTALALVRAGGAQAAPTGTILLQPMGAAELRVDGEAHAPAIAPGEIRRVEVRPGLHRIELVTPDGRRAAATVDVRPGEVAELLRIELR